MALFCLSDICGLIGATLLVYDYYENDEITQHLTSKSINIGGGHPRLAADGTCWMETNLEDEINGKLIV